MLNIGNKTFMNLQEAVGWLLENNALPFQSTANYVANTEIAMSTLVNPSPAKVRVGSLIFFADSKVSTVIGVTSNSFIVSDQYNDLVDDIVYVSNVAINASGHLICTLSNGDTIDAGLIKQVNNFSINGSQHLIANYNDGTSTDLGAIFSGNVSISGSLTADSIIENMSGYVFSNNAPALLNVAYAGAVKNGNKITFAVAGDITPDATFISNGGGNIFDFLIPHAVFEKLYPFYNSPTVVSYKNLLMFVAQNDTATAMTRVQKSTYTDTIATVLLSSGMTAGKTYYFRYEETFLLSDPLNS